MILTWIMIHPATVIFFIIIALGAWLTPLPVTAQSQPSTAEPEAEPARNDPAIAEADTTPDLTSAAENAPVAAENETASDAAEKTTVETERSSTSNESTAVAPETATDLFSDAEIDEKKAPNSVALRDAAHNRFLSLSDERRYEEAINAAMQVVELSRNEFGDDSMEMVAPLDNLATVQMRNGDLVDAQANYEASITIIERHESTLSKRLINPLIGLASTYNRAKLHDQAVTAFERALRINHVNEGFYNFEQFKIQDGLTESYIGLGELTDANFYQESQVEISQRKLGIDNPEIAPSLYKLARWYQRSGQSEHAAMAYQSARRILRDAYGKDDPALTEPLEGLAKVYSRQGRLSESASSLKKALAVVDAQPETDYLHRARLLVALGDLYNAFGKINSAQKHYQEAWQNLSLDSDFLDKRDEYFANPILVMGPSFSLLRFASTDRNIDGFPLKDGFVLVNYTVTQKGRIDDAKVIESEPPGLLDKDVVATLARSYYRPRYVDGVAVDSEGILYRHDFQYSESHNKQTASSSDDSDESADSIKPRDQSSGGRIEFPTAPDD